MFIFNSARKKISKLEIKHYGGFAYYLDFSSFDSVGNTHEFPRRSNLELFENGVPIAFKNSDVDKVQNYGKGRNNHFGGKLVFSATDNTDPRTNNKQYSYIMKEDKQINNNLLYPIDIGIEITNRCNARCFYCPLYSDRNTRLKYPLRAMDMRLFKRIVDELATFPQNINIYFNNGGEPLLDKEFEQRLRYCYKKGISEKIILQTNGMFLSEEKAKNILECGVSHIVPAFDGSTKEMFEKHRVNCEFDKVLNNIALFAELRNQGNYPTSIQIKFMRTKLNEHQINSTYELFNSFLSPILDRFQEEYCHTWNDTFLKQDENILVHVNSIEQKRHCRMANNYMAIFSNGFVGACSLDYNNEVCGIPMGNVMKASLVQIWNSDEFKQLRNAMSGSDTKELPLKCKSCYLMYFDELIVDPLLDQNLLTCKSGFSSNLYKFR